MKSLSDDPARMKAFLRAVMGPPTRKIEGKEFEHLMLLFKLMEPFKETNNQHSFTVYYTIGEKEYHVTWFPDSNGDFTSNPELEVIEDDI